MTSSSQSFLVVASGPKVSAFPDVWYVPWKVLQPAEPDAVPSSASRSVARVTTLDTAASAPTALRSHSVPVNDTAGAEALEKFSGVPDPVSESTSPTEKRLTASRAATYARSRASSDGSQ